MLRYIISFFIVASGFSAFTQQQSTDYPEIGKPCPDFTLTRLKDFPKSQVSKPDMKGKYFILYFWSNLCSACPASFPKTSALQKDFREKLTVFLIGDEEKRGRIKTIYQKLDKTFDLRLANTFDSTLFKSFVHYAVPHLIWVDTAGMVRAVTDASALERSNLQDFLDGKSLSVYDRSYPADQSRNQVDIDFNPTSATDKDLLYQSSLSRYDPADAFPGIYENVYRALRNEKKIAGCATLDRLYKLAYFGYAFWMENDSVYTKYYPAIRYELKDSSEFISDFVSGKGYYCYSLVVPPEKADPRYVEQLMQKDLDEYFGYGVRVETMEMPYWRLEVSERGRKNLLSKSTDKLKDHVEPAEIRLTNVSMSNLISNLFYKHIQDKPPIIDKTGIRTNVDFEIEGNLYDINALKTLLEKKGIYLIMDKMPFKVLVISQKNRGM